MGCVSFTGLHDQGLTEAMSDYQITGDLVSVAFMLHSVLKNNDTEQSHAAGCCWATNNNCIEGVLLGTKERS